MLKFSGKHAKLGKLGLIIKMNYSFLAVIWVSISTEKSSVINLTLKLSTYFQVNVLHMFVVLVLVVSILLGLKVVIQAFRFIAMYLSVLLLTKMMYQTKFIPKITMNTNCTVSISIISLHIKSNRKLDLLQSYKDLPFEERVWMMLTDLHWMGYHVLEKEESLLKMCRSYLLVLLVTTLQYVVYARQRWDRSFLITITNG